MSDYKLVPVRPTPEMCHAAEAALDDDQSWPAIWEEILDVAPDVQGELDVSALVEALEELVDLMQGVIDGDYEPDSFTLQPATTALARYHRSRPLPKRRPTMTTNKELRELAPAALSGLPSDRRRR